MVAAVGKHDGGRPYTLGGERGKEGAVGVRLRPVVAAAVQEDQQRPAARAAGRRRRDLVQRAVDEARVDVEADDGRAMRANRAAADECERAGEKRETAN